MHAPPDHHAGAGQRGRTPARWGAAAAVTAAAALSLVAGAAPASAAGGYAVTNTITVGTFPAGVAVDTATGTMYVANYESDTVSVIDEATGAVTTTITVGTYPMAVAADPVTGTVYVANAVDNTVSVINAATNTVTGAPIPVGSYPDGVAADPVSGTVYVTNFYGYTVSVISPQAAQAITFTSTPPASPVVGGTYPVSATGGASGNPVTFTIDAASTPVCSIAASTVTFDSAGSCVIDANQAGDTGYQAAPQAQQTVTVNQASTALAYTGPQSISAGTGLVPAAALSSPASACQASQPVTFTLGTNPTTGTTGTYPLEPATTSASGTATGAPVSTTGWLAGAYTITASYAGTGNCGASTATARLAVTTPGLAAAGAGSYPVTGAGTVRVGFIVAQIPHTSSYRGGISLVSTGGWRLAGTLSRYAMSSATQGTLTGTGSLYWWDKSLNRGHGGWQLARTGVAFTAGFTATTKTAPGSFGIQISYTPVSPQPAPLPDSSPVTLKSGVIVMAAGPGPAGPEIERRRRHVARTPATRPARHTQPHVRVGARPYSARTGHDHERSRVGGGGGMGSDRGTGAVGRGAP
jgi:YVTN family beta-propeller protein